MTPITATDAHEILGIPADSSLEDAQRAYRRLMMKYHPDRHTTASGAQQNIVEANMKRCKAAYEAIESGDLGKMSYFEGTLRGSHSTRQNTSSSFNDSFFHDDQNTEAPRSRNEAPFRRETRRAESGGLQTRAETFFNDPIVAVYENDTGTIIETLKHGFHWIRKGSRIIYPMYFSEGVSGVSYMGAALNWKTRIFDARLADGYASFEIKNGEVLNIDDLAFRRTHHVRPNDLNEKMVGRGFQLFTEKKLGPSVMNIWTYYAYQIGKDTIIIAETSLPTNSNGVSPGSLIRVFVGQLGTMRELTAHIDRTTNTIVVPDRDWRMKLWQGNSVSHFDKINGLFMGLLNQTEVPLRMRVRGEEVQIPSVDKKFRDGFSLVQWLGEHVLPPVIMSTPLDSKFPEQQLIRTEVRQKLRSVGTALERIEPTAGLARFLKFPEGDPRRRLVEILASEDPDLGKLTALTGANLANQEYAYAMIQLVYDVQDFNHIRLLLPLYARLTKVYLKDDPDGLLASLGKALSQHASHRNDSELAPILRDLINSGDVVVHSVMERAFGSVARMISWAQSSPCDRALQSGPNGSNR